MTALRDVRIVCGAIVIVAFALRMLTFAFHPELHPDEVYQYVDTAAFHMRGVGWQSWEWRDGARSWVLPGYHGAWLVLAGWFGIPRGLPQFYFLQIHWALISSVAWVGLGWWGASCLSLIIDNQASPPQSNPDRRRASAAVTGGFVLAVYPPLLPYGPRTLTEVPSAILLVLSLVATAQLVAGTKRPKMWATLVGISASAGVCLRVVNGPLALFPVAWLLWRRQWRWALIACSAAVVPLTLFGAVDWLTWGSPFSSYWTYIKFNFIEGKAADYGVAPAHWYAEMLWQRAGAGLIAILILAASAWRATWPFVCSALSLLTYLSLQPHKEERFILFLWPALLIPAAAVVATWFSQSSTTDRRLWLRAGALGGLILLLDGAGGVTELTWRTRGARIMQAQGFVSSKRDVTGFLLEENWDSGAYGAFAHDVPMLRYNHELLANRLFNYAVVASSDNVAQAQNAGFKVLKRWGEVVALRR